MTSRRTRAALAGLAAYVRSRREALGLSQKELAAHLALSASLVCDIEQGRRGLGPASIARLAAAGFSGDYLHYLMGELPSDLALAGLSEEEVLALFAGLRECRSPEAPEGPALPRPPRPGALVRFRRAGETVWGESEPDRLAAYPRGPRELVYLGPIPNRPGHCLVLDGETGRPDGSWHPDDFVEVEG